MKICVIGWYGTETIGDRAILAGLISVFKDVYTDFELELGSLQPFFTERTINEDYEFYKCTTGADIPIKLFDTKRPQELKAAIKRCDILVMGGGPLMDLDPMYMVEYAFKKAKKYKKKAYLLGCGIGPLYVNKYKKTLFRILDHADGLVMRSNVSNSNLKALYAEFKKELPKRLSIAVSIDPAAQCVMDYQRCYPKTPIEESYTAVNLRAFPGEYTEGSIASRVNEKLKGFIDKLCENIGAMPVRLIPMHYFYIGDDDRYFLNEIKLKLPERKNLQVQNHILSMVETMKAFEQAEYNIGMRFHSVVLQTLLNGKNLVLDYTQSKQGKITGFLKEIQAFDFYQNRMVNLQDEDDYNIILHKLQSLTAYQPDWDLLREKLDVYKTFLKTS